jgi:hypothetical protein
MHQLRKTLSVIGCAALIPTLFACASVTPRSGQLMATPPSEKTLRTELKKELSSLNVSIEATAQEIAENMNRMTPKELYKGSTKTKGLTADILRNGQITVNTADNYIHLAIPISMSLSYGMFETPAIAAKLKFKVSAKVTPDWKIKADIHYTGLSDPLVDEIKVGLITIKPRSIVEGATQPVQKILSDLISSKLNEKFPLKAQVAKVWTAAQKPVLLNKNYNAWLRIVPKEVLLYPLYAQNNQVRISVGLTSYADLIIGPEPPTGKTVPLPALKHATGSEKSFRILLHTDLFYRDILNIASPLLLNKELGNGGKSVILKDMDLYGNGDRLIIKVETTGSLDGIIYLTCKPVFNPQTNVFSVEDVDFDLQTRSLLMQSADWLLHSTIRSSIQEKLNLNLSQRLAQVRDMASKSLTRAKMAENVYLVGSVNSLQLNEVMVQKDKLSIQVFTEGETAIVFH